MIIKYGSNVLGFGNNQLDFSNGLLLDFFPNAAAAYSLRKLRTAYSGSAIRVRRSSDNTETDIGFVNDVLDTTSLLSFVGVGNGFVTRWYDQSSNSEDGLQSTLLNQPQIVSGGVVITQGTKPAISFNGTSHTLRTATAVFSTGGALYSIFHVIRPTKTTNSSIMKQGNNVLNQALGTFVRNSKPAHFWYDNDFDSTQNIILYNIFSALYDGTRRYNVINGVLESVISTGKNTGSTPLDIGNFTGANLQYGGTMQEIIIYNSNQLNNRPSIEALLNSYYSVY